MSKSRAANFPRWIKWIGSKINSRCRSVLNFHRSKTHPVRLKTKRRKNILTIIAQNLSLNGKYGQKQRLWSKGFILPTITMILIVFSLVVSSILLRTSQSTQATIGTRESDVTYNLATPAVERAKSKIEFLFKRDYRYPNTIPAEETLERLMLNQDLTQQTTQTEKVDRYLNEMGIYEDIYTLPGESRIDINKDKVVDNAWVYDTDIDGDGKSETVVYSILMMNNREIGVNSNKFSGFGGNYSFVPNSKVPNKTKAYDGTVPTDTDKAANLTTRTGPMTLLSGQTTAECSTGAQNNEGWYAINSATLRKNFQVNAVVVKKNEAIRTVSSIEFQQDRQVDKGNKWAVWFRYDLEVFPGPDFNMNGAMHTEGNLIWGDGSSNGIGIKSYLVSAPASCFYTEDTSEITLSQVENKKGNITFQGQILNGSPRFDDYTGQSKIDIFPGSKTEPTGGNKAVELKIDTDSIADNLQTGSPYQFSLDPISVFTKDVSESRYSDNTNKTIRDSKWETSKLHERLFNKSIRRPFVDDTYRADDRWGPKPLYNEKIAVPKSEYGSLISGKDRDELTQEDPPSSFPDRVGLDGYWERRARWEGLRIITGQRLELGNAFGWKGDQDSLYPPNSTLKNLDRQRRTVRDNLAAVQSTLLYHYKNNKDFPIATLATTVHPGTAKTRDQATTFRNLPYKYKNEALAIPDTVEKDHVNTDFLTGVGTNGWEFNAPGNAADQTAFAKIIEDSSNPLRIALDNLARFASDPDGAFPPKAETKTATIHPYPLLSMWGNFSELRKALSLMKTIDYMDLSIADRTTIQTAAATVGLLAYNIDNVNKIYKQIQDDPTAEMEKLGAYFWTLMDGVETSKNLEIAPIPAASAYDRTGDKNGSKIADSIEFYNKIAPDIYLSAFSTIPMPTATKDKEKLIAKVRNLMLYAQIERDRFLGFKKGAGLTSPIKNSAWSKTFKDINSENHGIVKIEETLGDASKMVSFKTACDPASFINVDLVALAPNAATLAKKRNAVALATAFCSNAPNAEITPKYPALYFIFPKYNHNYEGMIDAKTDNAFGVDDNQPKTEPYIADIYISNTSIGSSFLFKVLKDANNNTYEDPDVTENGIAAIALQPRALADWKIPNLVKAKESDLVGTSDDLINKIDFCDDVYCNNSNRSYVRIPFLDKAFYDGRQFMQVRSLDIDLKMLRDTPMSTDTWLTQKGIIYAFREDAIREDAIARPAGTTFDQCDTDAKLITDSCRMKVSKPQDPPNNDDTGVSLKPIDFYPDPDRRPYGFRLKNGVDISRNGTISGVSFISDNPIYIQGDLNLHQDSSNNLLEEFTEKLNNDWKNFYTRSTKDTDFAKASSDRWRPVEILGDALTILSKDFCDGTFEDGMLETSPKCSSYLNSTLADKGSSSWTRENPNDSSNNSPILVDRNAQIFLSNGTPFTDYRTLGSGKNLNKATDTSINATLINGLVPSRQYQSYGGLHNFPRFIENWDDKDLRIFGAFIQLKFSTYATAPYEQEAWEPGEDPVTGTNIPFYFPPDRKWGYDVALQYAPPGPVADRFVSVGSPRNEFYEQLSADDPYTKQLRCAEVNGNPIDFKAKCP